jgi:hypothetical protein
MLIEDAPAASHRNEAPPAALWSLALLALAPFPIASGAYVFGQAAQRPGALTVLLTWSAMVLGFLGGVRWGMETNRASPRWQRMAVSVLSAVVAWILILSRREIADSWILGGTIAAFLAQWIFDHQTPDAPSRYPKLSTAVTGAACVCLAFCLDVAIRS